MNIFITFTVLRLFLIACWCVSEECPADWFDVSFSIIIDMLISKASFNNLDSNLHHFKETLKLSDEEIEEVTQDAIEFYNTTYGLDFSQSPVDAAGWRHFENATMFPFEVPFDIPVSHNRQVINGKKGVNRCLEGGYNVSFTGLQTLRGTYGGKEGRVLPFAVQIAYSLLNFNFCRQQLTLITCATPQPTFRDPGGYATRIGDCYNREIGHGHFQGVQGRIPTDDPDLVHLIIHHVLTFPPHPF